MSAAEVRDRFRADGGDADVVVWLGPGEQPSPTDETRWIVAEVQDQEVVLGGMDRGRFAAYARFDDPRVAAEVLRSLVDRPAPPALPRTAEELDRAAQGVVAQLGAAGPEAAVPVGAPLDHLGNGSGHVLHPWGTPMSQRSVPPTHLSLPRTGYLLLRPLPEACRAVRVEPWFGQPGGGWMVVLDRVIDYYCDTGVLRAFAIPSDPRG